MTVSITFEVVTTDSRKNIDVDTVMSEDGAITRAKLAIVNDEARTARVVRVTRETVAEFKAEIRAVEVVSIDRDKVCVLSALKDYLSSSGSARHESYAAYTAIRTAFISQHGEEFWLNWFNEGAPRGFGMSVEEYQRVRDGLWGSS